jgi:hypothetical protein
MYKYISAFNRIALGPMLTSIFILWSSASLSENIQGDSFEIGSIPMSKNISAVIRLMCFDNDSIIIVSNTLGSDAVVVASDSCGSNDVTDYKFIFAEKLKTSSSGIMRKVEIKNHVISVYSAKGQAPVISKVN